MRLSAVKLDHSGKTILGHPQLTECMGICILDTGRSFFFRSFWSRHRFLRRGSLIAVLNMEGNMPERKHPLTTCVTASTTSSIHSKSRDAGIGSSSQFFGDDFKIIFLTSSSDTGRKDEREQATDCSSLTPKHTNWAWLSRLWRTVCTLLKKKSAKCWGSWTGEYTVSGAEGFLREAIVKNWSGNFSLNSTRVCALQ